MARGNWQRRVENAEARRVEQKKVRQQGRDVTNKKSEYQQHIRLLFSSLDEYYRTTSEQQQQQQLSPVIHLWLDRIPLSSSSSSSSPSINNKPNSSIQPEHNTNSKKKIHPRSSSNSTKFENNISSISDSSKCCCRQFFFYGQCHDSTIGPISTKPKPKSTKKLVTACIHHLQHISPSLVQTLSLEEYYKKNSLPLLSHQLKCSFEAAVSTNSSRSDTSEDHHPRQESSDPTVNLLFHHVLNVQNTVISTAEDDILSEENNSRPSFFIQQALIKDQISLTSIVYVVIDGHYWFDRNCGGLLDVQSNDNNNYNYNNNNKTNAATIPPDILGKKNLSVNEEEEEVVVVPHNNYRTVIPSHLLEFIFVFLPDSYIQTLSMVCKVYAKEISFNTNLWRFLLQRRKWPSDDANITTTFEHRKEENDCRNTFNSHVVASNFLQTFANDVTSVICGLGTSHTNRTNSSSSSSIMVFKATKGAPTVDNKCISFKLLDNNDNRESSSSMKAIGAFSQDGTLRAFESIRTDVNDDVATDTTATTGVISTSSSCRQIVSVRATPFIRDSALIAMDMDDNFIACLYRGPDDENKKPRSNKNRRSQAVVLNVLRKEDFWCSDGIINPTTTDGCNRNDDNNSNNNNTSLLINLHAAIVEFLQQQQEQLVAAGNNGSSDGIISTKLADTDTEAPHDQKQNSYHDVHVSPSIAACGYGHFIFHVGVVIIGGNNNLQAQQEQKQLNNSMATAQQQQKHYLAIYSASLEKIIVLHDITTSASSSSCFDKNIMDAEIHFKLTARHENGSSHYANKKRRNANSSQSCVIVAIQEHPSFQTMVLLGHVRIELGRSAIIDSVSVLEESINLPIVNSLLPKQNNNWIVNSVVVEVMPSSQIIVVAKNQVIQDAATINPTSRFNTILSFWDSQTGSSINAISLGELDNCITDSIHAIGDRHVLLLGRFFNSKGEKGIFDANGFNDMVEEYNALHVSSPTSNNTANIINRKRQWHYFGSIIHVPSGEDVCRVHLDALFRDQSYTINNDINNTPSSCPLVVASNGKPYVAAIPLGRGMIMTGVWECIKKNITSPTTATSTSSHGGHSTRNSPKKKKKIVTKSSNGKKDGFARGMSLRG